LPSKSLIILDIDKTIKPYGQPIPKEIYNEIKRLADAGNIIAFATGRSIFDMKKIENEAAGANQYSVYLNGSIAAEKISYGEHSILHSKTFDGFKVYDSFKSHIDEHYTISDVFAPNFDMSGFIHREVIDVYHDAQGYEIVDHPTEVIREELLKLSVIPEENIDIKYQSDKIRELVSNMVSHHIYDNKIIEIAAHGVNKAEGMKPIFSKAESQIERVIAVGDNYNDIELMQWVNSIGGESYAVGNAVESLKLVTKNILPDISDGGALDLLKNL
jgi:HAD superfamily hydrolase (TIGR01484 family)